MRKLILIKHAAPDVRPEIAPELWPLSEAGRAQCVLLAEAIRIHEPARIVCSDEAKAAETGQLLGARLAVPSETQQDFGEHDRTGVSHMPSRDYISMMEVLFRRPGERVLGRESADEALERFETAISNTIGFYPLGNIAVVSHGTVIALFLSKHGGGAGFQIWRRMGLPSFAVLTIPELRVGSVVLSINAPIPI